MRVTVVTESESLTLTRQQRLASVGLLTGAYEEYVLLPIGRRRRMWDPNRAHFAALAHLRVVSKRDDEFVLVCCGSRVARAYWSAQRTLDGGTEYPQQYGQLVRALPALGRDTWYTRLPDPRHSLRWWANEEAVGGVRGSLRWIGRRVVQVWTKEQGTFQ